MRPDLEIVKQAAEALGILKLAPVVYQDALQPAVRQFGQHFLVVAKAMGITLAPLEMGLWGYEQAKCFLAHRVAARLANKPPDEIKPAARNIAGAVVMGLAFAADEPHLREMYANLLATAMHGPSAEKAHPSFVQIIQQLSPAEASILKEIAKGHTAADVIISDMEQRGRELYLLPLGVPGQWEMLCAACGIEKSPMLDAYYNNLIRLGILNELVTGSGEIANSNLSDNRGVAHGLVLTPYGDMFLDVCVRDG